ncbi:MAG: hypothetical protein DMG98_18650 [Acidobacteria bacterium]|nr:MAG: hypothetical protein DMG98_18650 [Acidobacteriota bacterium]
MNITEIATDELYRVLTAAIRKSETYSPYQREELNLDIGLESAPLLGDDQRVMAITTRMGSILQAGSDLLRMWQTIRTAAVQLAKNGAVQPMMCALRIASAFNSTLWQRDPVGYRQDSYSTWRSQISEFRDILGDLGIKDELPTDLHDRISREVIFDASSFWRDWDRRDS